MSKHKTNNKYESFCTMDKISQRNFLNNMQNDFITYLNTIEKFYDTDIENWDTSLQPFLNTYINEERLENIIILHKLCYFLYTEYYKWETEYNATFEDTSYITPHQNGNENEKQGEKQFRLGQMPFVYDETILFLDCLYDYITKVTRLEGLELAQSAQDVINFLSTPPNKDISNGQQSTSNTLTNKEIIEAYVNAVEETKAQSQDIAEYIKTIKPIKEKAKNTIPELTKRCNSLKTHNDEYLNSLKQYNPQKDYTDIISLLSNPKIQTLLSYCYELYSQQINPSGVKREPLVVAGFPGVGKTTLAKKYKEENETLEDALKQRGIKLIPREITSNNIQTLIDNINLKYHILYPQNILESLLAYYGNDEQLIGKSIQSILATTKQLKDSFVIAEKEQGAFEQLSRTPL